MSFNFEDKIKWSELSPSLQKRFTDVENKVRLQAGEDVGKLGSTRITISRKAPVNPINNAELWIDQKYRVARTFNENYWEFTRAVWAKGSMSSPPDPARKDGELPGGGYTPYVPTKKTYTLFTYTDNGSTSNIAPSAQSYDAASGTVAYNFTGSNADATITVDLSKCTNSNTDLLAYLLIIVGDQSISDKALYTGYAYEISKKYVINNFKKIGSGKYTKNLGSSIISSGKCIMGEVESKRRGAKALKYVDPGDAANSDVGTTKFSASQYPYPYPTSSLGSAIVIGYTDEGGSKPRPPFAGVTGFLSISIEVTEET